MRPIVIDDNLFEFAKTFSKNLFKDRQFEKPLDALNRLLSKYSQLGLKNEIRILKFIIKLYKKDLLYCKPEKQQMLVDIVDKYYPNIFFNNNAKSVFSIDLLMALRYSELQKDEAHKIAKRLKIKACPYCNATLTIVLHKQQARYQLDHFFPKAKYPFLSTSFFNLIPSCANCNQGKSAKNVRLKDDFHLYSMSTPSDPFKFNLNKADAIRQLIGCKNVDISFSFTFKDIKDEGFVKKHEKEFKIQGIYNTQKDIIEELIWKSKAYNSTKIDELQKLLKLRKNEIKRLIIGNYAHSSEIHKRPLAKFTQDIASDLKLI